MRHVRRCDAATCELRCQGCDTVGSSIAKDICDCHWWALTCWIEVLSAAIARSIHCTAPCKQCNKVVVTTCDLTAMTALPTGRARILRWL